jgi:hypothetical protein
MVITKHFLSEKMGIDFGIAQFFADRKVPADNLYWKNKFLYVTYGTGYLFIPIVYDLLYKSGIPKDLLLREDRVEDMEKAFHIVAEYETKRIPFEEYIHQFMMVFRDKAVNKKFFNDLIRYFRNEPCQHYALGTSINALNRADAFLFTITDLPLEDQVLRTLLTKWYYTAASILILDDLVDWEKDQAEAEENVIIELGNNKNAILQVQKIFETNLKGLQDINPVLGSFFQKIFEKAIQDPPIRKSLEEQ